MCNFFVNRNSVVDLGFLEALSDKLQSCSLVSEGCVNNAISCLRKLPPFYICVFSRAWYMHVLGHALGDQVLNVHANVLGVVTGSKHRLLEVHRWGMLAPREKYRWPSS